MYCYTTPGNKETVGGTFLLPPWNQDSHKLVYQDNFNIQDTLICRIAMYYLPGVGGGGDWGL